MSVLVRVMPMELVLILDIQPTTMSNRNNWSIYGLDSSSTAEAIFTSSYGNILVIKLFLALPMIVLGGYHQLKLHGSLMTIVRLNKDRQERNGDKQKHMVWNQLVIMKILFHRNTIPQESLTKL